MHTLRLMTLSGAFRIVAEHDVSKMDEARAIVEKHAAEGNFRNVKIVSDNDCSLRFTATTPGGRGGRNVAFLDYGYDGDVEGV